MRIRRIVPPAAAILGAADLCNGLSGLLGRDLLGQVRKELAEYFQVRHVFLVSSGKTALSLILMAIKDLTKRNKVLIPAYTCYSVPSAVVRSGMKISLSDIRDDTFDFDVERIGNALDNDTACMVTNNLFGIPSDIEGLRSRILGKGVFVVEDAAQAMGVRCEGKAVGTRGDVGFFSLGRGKNITCGAGGVIVTDSDEISTAIQRQYSLLETPGFMGTLSRYGKAVVLSILVRPNLFWLPSGIPSLRLGDTIFDPDFPCHRLSRMETGLLKDWQTRLKESNKIRLANSRLFVEKLELKNRGNGSIPYLRLPVLVESREMRDRIFAASVQAGLGLSRMYPAPVSEIRELKSEFSDMEFPVARKVSERILTLPTHPYLSERDRMKICGLFDGCLSHVPEGNPGIRQGLSVVHRKV